MRNEQEKKINIVLSVIALEFITETETPSNLSTAFLDVRLVSKKSGEKDYLMIFNGKF